MATPEKVREFMTATEVEKGYEALLMGVCRQLEHDAVAKNDEEAFRAAGSVSAMYEAMKTHVVGFISKHSEESYTDDELDQLIAIYNLPISKKARDQMPAIQQGMIQLLNGLNFSKLIDDMMTNLEA